jgi:hypothetical protein
MGVNRPSVESSDLTTAREIVPHATSPEGKRQEECAITGRREGGETKREELWRYAE